MNKLIQTQAKEYDVAIKATYNVQKAKSHPLNITSRHKFMTMDSCLCKTTYFEVYLFTVRNTTIF